MSGEIETYSQEEKTELLKLARDTIEQYLSGGKRDCPEVDNPRFKLMRGVFVTLHRSGQLRGCIGYPLPTKPLYQAVIDNAIASAVDDPRFPPVRYEELTDIDIEISVLTEPRSVRGVEDVEVGRDGIIISKGFNRGLLLPQVPVQYGWDREVYLSHGCEKAGLASDEWRRGVQIETFQAIVFGEK